MKTVIRFMLVTASFFMIVGNLDGKWQALTASILFFSANLMALIYNQIKRKESK